LNNNSNNNNNVTQSDSSYYIVSQVEKIKQLGVNNMDPQEIIQNSELSDTDKQVVLSALNKKSDVPEKDELEKKLTDKENENSVLKLRIEELSEQNKTFSKKLTDIEEQEHAKEKRNIIETALSDGRILPVNKEKWEKAFDKDPENVKELLDAKQPEVDLTSKGTSSSGAGEEVILTDKEKSLIKQLGLTEEEYRQYTEIEGE
jgi:phage I-like protein